jgi:hypothetical protein
MKKISVAYFSLYLSLLTALLLPFSQGIRADDEESNIIIFDEEDFIRFPQPETNIPKSPRVENGGENGGDSSTGEGSGSSEDKDKDNKDKDNGSDKDKDNKDKDNGSDNESWVPCSKLPAKFVPKARLAMGLTNYKYNEDYPDTEDVKWQDHFIPTLGLGVTLGCHEFSLPWLGNDHFVVLDAFYQTSMLGHGKDSQFDITQLAPGIERWRDYDVGFKWKDLAINASYGKKFKMFGFHNVLAGTIGWKDGEIKLSGPQRDTINNISELPKIHTTQFETTGWTGGLSYLLFLNNKQDNIGIKVAYAELDGSYSNTLLSGREITLDKTKGWTYGMFWNHKITRNLGFGLSVDCYNYDTVATINEVNRNFTIRQDIRGVNASLSYRLW